MFKIKKRCFFCNKVLREDGTCQNPNCPQYVEEKTEDNTSALLSERQKARDEINSLQKELKNDA